jgi:hypothetical protein
MVDRERFQELLDIEMERELTVDEQMEMDNLNRECKRYGIDSFDIDENSRD